MQNLHCLPLLIFKLTKKEATKMENDKFNAAVAGDFLEKVSQCLYQEYDAIYDLNFTEDNFNIEKLLFH